MRRAVPSGVVVRKAGVVFDTGDIVRTDFAIPQGGQQDLSYSIW